MNKQQEIRPLCKAYQKRESFGRWIRQIKNRENDTVLTGTGIFHGIDCFDLGDYLNRMVDRAIHNHRDIDAATAQTMLNNLCRSLGLLTREYKVSEEGF